jgi:MFS family permease
MTDLTASPESPAPDPLSPNSAGPGGNIFRHLDYRVFWIGRLLSTLAVMCEAVTIGWQVYAVARRTHSVDESAFLVGMVGLAQFVPLFALTLFAGEAADRYDRKRIMIGCILVYVVGDAVLALAAFQQAPPLALIFTVAAVFGAARAFPTSSALAPMLVPRAELPRAVAWSSLAWQGGAVIGPVLAGLLVGVSPVAAYGGAALLYAGAAISTLLIRGNTKPVYEGGDRWTRIREGLSYVWSNKVVLGAISLDLFAVLLGGATALLPVFARDVLHAGPFGFGLLRTGPAIGAASAAFVLSRRPLKRRAGLWMFGGVAAFGIATLVFAVSKLLVVSVIALAILGAGDMLSVNIRQSLEQIATPDAMRGRVSAIASVFVGASNELGEFETGVVARWLGPVGAAIFGGVGSLVVTGLWARLCPALRKADQLVTSSART